MGGARSAQGMAELIALQPKRGSLIQRDGVVFAIFLALTAILTNPLALHLAHAVEDKQDALLNTWIIAWVGHALITDPFNLFNANIFYPYSNTLAFSETLLPQGLFALPFNLAFDNTLLGYNLTLLASFWLAAYAMYLFVYDLTRARGAAIVAGTIFAFNPYNLGNLAQVQLLSFGWLPLALLWLRKMLTPQVRDQKSAAKSCFLFAAFFSLQALSSFYYAFLAGLAVALYVVWFFVTRSARVTAQLVTRLTLAAALVALFVVPFFVPYLQAQREMGFERKLGESEEFSAALQLYAQVAPHNVLYGNLLAPRAPIVRGGYPLDNLFPGVVAVVLGIFGVAATQNRERWFHFLLLTFAFVLSLGPRLYVTPTAPTDLTLPYRWLYDAFPLLRALRAPVRFDALVMFALAVLAGFGMWRMARKPFVLHPSSFILPLVALEYLALPAAQITRVPVGDEIPEYVRWLRAQPRGVILELPMLASDPTQPLDLTTQYFSTYHWHATPDGYSGFNPPRRGEIAYEMQAFPSERAFSLIQALDVKYLIIHHSAPLEAHGEMEIAKGFGDTWIYTVAPFSFEKQRLGARLYLPAPAMPASTYTAFWILNNPSPRSFAIKPTTQLHIEARWDDDVVQPTTATLPLVTSHVSVVPIRITTPAQAGEYALNLQVAINGVAAWSYLAGKVEIKNADATHEVVLPASVRLAMPLQAQYAPGGALPLDLVWIPFNKIDAYYSASVRVVDAHGEKILAQDREPKGRTFLWRPNVTVNDAYNFTLPRELAPGEYRIQVKMYQAEQGVDALLLDEHLSPRETIELGTFTVK